jgi:hypothetical protein
MVARLGSGAYLAVHAAASYLTPVATGTRSIFVHHLQRSAQCTLKQLGNFYQLIEKTHAMRNEMHIRLKCLHRLAQFLRLFLVKGSEISLSYDNRRARKDALKQLR